MSTAAIAAITGTLLLAGTGTSLASTSAQARGASSAKSAAGAAAAPDPVPSEGATITLNDGSVVRANDTVKFSFAGEINSQGRGLTPDLLKCPEVDEPPVYTVTGSPYFLPDKGKPQSTWLLPRQTVSWTVTGSHTFTWDIGAGVEAEANAVIAKAKVRVDTKISNSWTWSGSQTITDTNTTKTAYRAVLGQVGWKLKAVKSWVTFPCTGKSKTIVIYAPRKGDLSIGRQSS